MMPEMGHSYFVEWCEDEAGVVGRPDGVVNFKGYLEDASTTRTHVIPLMKRDLLADRSVHEAPHHVPLNK